MKVAILAAGDNRKYFPLFINKPKCLYHQNGEVQLERVINDAKAIVDEKDIIVVGGYKYKKVEKYLKKNHPHITFKNNQKYLEPAIYSFRAAIEDVNDDFVFMFGDESINLKNIKKIAESDKKLSIMYHDKHYYYSLGIFKLRKDNLYIINDDKYLDLEEIKKIYKYANGKEYEGGFSINSGICIGYMMIDMITRIGGFEKIEYPGLYKGSDIDFIHYDPSLEYFPDLDNIYATDEYKNNFVLKVYNKFFSNPVKELLYKLHIWTR